MITNEKCYIKGCNNNIFLVKIDNKKVIEIIGSYLDPLLDRKQIDKLLKFKNVLDTRNSDYCEKCLNENYGWFIPSFKRVNINIPYEKFSDLYVAIAHDIYISEFYSSLFDDKDSLKRSIIKMLTHQLNTTEEELKNEYDPEFLWFLAKEKYNSIPVYWQKYFILKEYIGKGTKQGEKNGPDFIFEDIKTKKTYGFEVFSFNNNMVHTNKPIKDFGKFVKSAFPEKIKRGKPATLIDYINEIKEKIDNKLNKNWKGYKETDYKALGVVLLNSIPNEWYPILNVFFNTYYKNEDNKIERIIFL